MGLSKIFWVEFQDWFKELESQKDIIEKELGEKLSWQLLPEKAASRIALYRSNSDIENTDDWKEMLKWLVLKLEKLRIVFSPRLKNLRLDSEEGN